MSENKTTLANHNARLDALVDAVNALPDAGGGEVAEPVVQPLSVTQNGTYTPPEGVDGYAPVNVNVPSSGGIGDGNVRVNVLLETEVPIYGYVFYEDGNGDGAYLEIKDSGTSRQFTNTAAAIAVNAVYVKNFEYSEGATLLLESDSMYVFGFTPEIKDAKLSFYA